MNRSVIIGIVVALLLVGLVGVSYASYSGFGLISGGGPSARVGSIGGPLVVGGGPGSGK
jgi:hypothetical protein